MKRGCGGEVAEAPHLKGGRGSKPPSLGCFCAYIGISGSPFAIYSPHPKTSGSPLVGWLEGFCSSFY